MRRASISKARIDYNMLCNNEDSHAICFSLSMPLEPVQFSSYISSRQSVSSTPHISPLLLLNLSPRSRLQLLHNRRLYGLNMRTHHLTYLLPTLEDHKGRHGADAELLGHVGDLVDVELVEAGARVGVGELDDFGGDDFAGAAPGGHAVDDHEGGVGEGGGVVGFAGGWGAVSKCGFLGVEGGGRVRAGG